MTKKPDDQTSPTPDAARKALEREARQAAALRENLKRRKEAARARQHPGSAPDPCGVLDKSR